MYCKLIKVIKTFFVFKYKAMMKQKISLKYELLFIDSRTLSKCFTVKQNIFYKKASKYLFELSSQKLFSTGFLHWFQWPYHGIRRCVTNRKRFLVND